MRAAPYLVIHSTLSTHISSFNLLLSLPCSNLAHFRRTQTPMPLDQFQHFKPGWKFCCRVEFCWARMTCVNCRIGNRYTHTAPKPFFSFFPAIRLSTATNLYVHFFLSGYILYPSTAFNYGTEFSKLVNYFQNAHLFVVEQKLTELHRVVSLTNQGNFKTIRAE